MLTSKTFINFSFLLELLLFYNKNLIKIIKNYDVILQHNKFAHYISPAKYGEKRDKKSFFCLLGLIVQYVIDIISYYKYYTTILKFLITEKNILNRKYNLNFLFPNLENPKTEDSLHKNIKILTKLIYKS